MKRCRYFTESEFQACQPACSIEDMDSRFLSMMDKVRDAAGIPLVLSSAYRSKEWDRSKGRSGNGAHCFGLAVDIRCNTSQNRLKIVKAALSCGIRRIGIGKTYVHIDMGEHCGLQPGIWHYYT